MNNSNAALAKQDPWHRALPQARAGEVVGASQATSDACNAPPPPGCAQPYNRPKTLGKDVAGGEVQEHLDLYRTCDQNPKALDGCPRPIVFRLSVCDASTGEVRETEETLEKPCGRWSCPWCGPAKQHCLVAHFVNEFARLPELWFITLTLDPKTGIRAEMSRKYLIELFSVFRKRVNYRVKKEDPSKKLHYVGTIEMQKRTGLAHFHAVVSAPGVDAEELGATWFEVGGGVVAHVQPLDDTMDLAQHVGYALKYALKDALEDPCKGRQYVLCSQGIGYNTEKAKAARREYMREKGQLHHAFEEPKMEDGEPVPVLIWSTESVNVPCGNPDEITEEDRKYFASLNLDARTTEYRWYDRKTGLWWKITQQSGVRRRICLGATYRSPSDAKLQYM